MKTIIVAFDGTPGAQAALGYALTLAARSDGHVTAVFAHASADVYAAQGNWIPPEARAVIAESNARLSDAVRAAFDEAAKPYGPDAKLSFEMIGGRVDDVLARRARSADLLVTSRPAAESDMHVVQHPDQIALRSGRPLLVVSPDAKPPAKPGPVVVAWDGKRAAARALADAIPIILPGSDVSLLTIGSETLTRPGKEILDHLARYGIGAKHVVLDRKGSVTDLMIDYCNSSNPNLLVMGAYEHSKFQVGLSGGPTLEVLHRANLPVLMSH